ncbi:MAG: CHAT domain-containing protein [Nitrospinae bacterium]|nr:CHAT domain-containing protein [Nitrospinota bacterium]
MGHKILLRFVSITLMSLLLSGGLAVGQEDVTERVENLNAEVMELYQAGKYTEALVPARRVLELSEEALGPDHPDVAFALNVLGLLYHDLGDYAQAEPLYRRALAIDEKTLSPEHPVVAVSLNNLGLLYDATGGYTQAEPLFHRSLAIWEQALGSEHPKVALALNNLSGLVAGQKKYPTALGLMQRGLRIQSRQLRNIFSFTTERQKLAFLHRVSGDYEAYLSLLHQHFITDPHVVNQGLALVLQRKGVVLDAQSRICTAMKGRLSEAARKNSERLSALRSQQSHLVLNKPKNLALKEYRQRLATLQTEIQTIEQTLASDSAIVAKDLKQRTITVDAVARALPKEAVLVEFAKIRDWDFDKGQWKPTSRYLAFVLNKKGNVTLVDLGEAEALEAQVTRALAAIRISLSSLQRVSIQRSLEALTTLSERIWTPLAPTLGDATQLLLSPDGQLNLVPFAALRDTNGRFVVEHYQVTYLSSGRDLIGVEDGVTAPSRELLLVANPTYGATLSVGNQTERAVRSADWSLNFSDLPGTKQEAQRIPPLVPGSTPEDVLVGKAARESVVKAARSPRILHLATHGFFLADQPLAGEGDQRGLIRGGSQFGSEASVPQNYENPLIRSGLAFAGANHAAERTTGEDGLLTALEITGMDLSGTELVVLSACETALGEIQTGEGVFGLRRAFSLAGTQNLLMSLWPVSDAITAQQMRTFYTNLQNQPPAQAIRNAQLATIKKLRAAYKGLAPPALWAPFILQGAPVVVN